MILNLIILGAVGMIVWGLYEMTKSQPAKQDYSDVPYGTIFHEAELKYGLPRYLLVEVARQESGFDPDAINVKSGAAGIMQIVPKWHPTVNPYDPFAAIPYAAQYLKQLRNTLGTWRAALAAYNWGIGNMQNYGMAQAPTETRNYVARISSRLPYTLV